MDSRLCLDQCHYASYTSREESKFDALTRGAYRLVDWVCLGVLDKTLKISILGEYGGMVW